MLFSRDHFFLQWLTLFMMQLLKSYDSLYLCYVGISVQYYLLITMVKNVYIVHTLYTLKRNSQLQRVMSAKTFP